MLSQKGVKGFSLVELLAVIVVMAILAVAAVPAMLSVSRNNKNNMFCKKIQTIIRSAELYGSDNFKEIDDDKFVDANVACGLIEDKNTLATQKHCQVTTVELLADSGYVNYEKNGKNNYKSQILDPRSSTSMLKSKIMVFIVNKRVHAQYVYNDMRDALLCSSPVKVGSARLRELYFQDGENIRKVNCTSGNLEECKKVISE